MKATEVTATIKKTGQKKSGFISLYEHWEEIRYAAADSEENEKLFLSLINRQMKTDFRNRLSQEMTRPVNPGKELLKKLKKLGKSPEELLALLDQIQLLENEKKDDSELEETDDLGPEDGLE